MTKIEQTASQVEVICTAVRDQLGITQENRPVAPCNVDVIFRNCWDKDVNVDLICKILLEESVNKMMFK
tara:strand:- start:623 stop:829 length:207 start_codon:yes stop_codon:yes gene_type:complete